MILWVVASACLPPEVEEPTEATSFESAPGTEVALALTFAGTATVVVGAQWDGEEHALWTNPVTGVVVCDFVWTSTDFSRAPGHEGEADPFGDVGCEDPQGVACAFAESVWLSDGHEAAGQCGALGYDAVASATTGPFGYGFHDAWTVDGFDFGAVLAWYEPPSGEDPGGWVGWPDATVAFDGALFNYTIPWGTVTAEVR